MFGQQSPCGATGAFFPTISYLSIPIHNTTYRGSLPRQIYTIRQTNTTLLYDIFSFECVKKRLTLCMIDLVRIKKFHHIRKEICFFIKKKKNIISKSEYIPYNHTYIFDRLYDRGYLCLCVLILFYFLILSHFSRYKCFMF